MFKLHRSEGTCVSEMEEEVINIEKAPLKVQECNVFKNQTVIMNDDGSLQLVGVPSSEANPDVNELGRGTAFMNSPSVSMGVPVQSAGGLPKGDIFAMFHEQMMNNQKMFLEQQKTINNLSQSISEFKNVMTTRVDSPTTVTHARPTSPVQGTSQRHSYYDSVSEEESDRDYESSVESEEPKEKRQKLDRSITPSKVDKLKKVEKALLKQPKLEPPVDDAIASIVNQGSEATVDHRSKEVVELLEKYNRPENCEYLEVPKVNKVLWTSKEIDKRLKDTDKNFQRTQGYLVKGMIPLVRLMDKSLKSSSEESEENFELALDSLNLLLYAHRDLSSQRKRLLTPALDRKYSALSNEAEKVSAKFLFGEQEDLEKRMKEIDDSLKLGKKIGSTKSHYNKEKPRETEKVNKEIGVAKVGGFKSHFLAKRAQMNREDKKKPKKGRGNLGHKRQ